MVRMLAMASWGSFIRMSPVDTGYFRANWVMEAGTAQISYESRAQDPRGFAGWMSSAPSVRTVDNLTLGKLPHFPKVTIYNPLPYAVALEFGHSGQAPQGMVRITLANLAD